VICGLYQLFGQEFVTLEGKKLPGIAVFNTTTNGSKVRMIGNVTVETEAFGRLVGFENHSGQTILAESQGALGKVVKGFGNNSTSGFEGSRSGAAIGTYLHGPVLPRNPRLADFLLATALRRRYGVDKLSRLDDTWESSAASVADSRPQ
jgi:hypothetical protein